MNSNLSYSLSFVLAVSLHAGVVMALMSNWEQEITIETEKIERFYIDAALVTHNPVEARQELVAKEAERRRILKQMQEAEARVNRQRLIEEEKELEQLAQLQKEADLKARLAAELAELAETAEPASNINSERQEQARVKAEQSMFLELLDEQDYRRAVTDDEKAMAYVAQIQREIIQNWSRPPSARNGMQALLRVFLVPTGEVIEVSVEESSGNEAFDRSAILAVEKSQRFEVPSDPRRFERNFREFEVLFRPEDLRL